jgi:hypothetical protein
VTTKFAAAEREPSRFRYISGSWLDGSLVAAGEEENFGSPIRLFAGEFAARIKYVTRSISTLL